MDEPENLKEYNFVFELMPIPYARPRVRKNRRFYDPRAPFKVMYREDIGSQIAFDDLEFLKNAKYLDFDCVYYFKIPKSYSKKQVQNMHHTPRVQTPDVDNLLKFTLDTFLPFVRDDGCVYEIKGKKLHDKNKYWSTVTIKAYTNIPEQFDFQRIPRSDKFDFSKLE